MRVKVPSHKQPEKRERSRKEGKGKKYSTKHQKPISEMLKEVFPDNSTR